MKNILLCVAGGTPQIVTETLWALVVDGNERIDEIRVITTLDGRDKITTGVIDDWGSAEESLLHPEKGQFFQFIKDYPQAENIKFTENEISLLRLPDGRILSDIRTRQENELAGDQICEIVRELCRDENIRLFASAAGGRKTMSIYLTAAMQLFGRADDSLSHVLISKEFETNKNFFYPPPEPRMITNRNGKEISTEQAEIHLAPIPFVRLRGIGREFKEEFGKYADIVNSAQQNLERYDLKINLKTGQIKVGDRVAILEPVPFFVFVIFSYLKLKDAGKNGFLEVNEILLEDLDQVCRLISKARGEEMGYENFDMLRGESLTKLQIDFLKSKYPNKGKGYILNEIKSAYSNAVSDIRRQLKKAGISEDYFIHNNNRYRKNVEAIYGMRIEPERIKLGIEE